VSVGLLLFPATGGPRRRSPRTSKSQNPRWSRGCISPCERYGSIPRQPARCALDAWSHQRLRDGAPPSLQADSYDTRRRSAGCWTPLPRSGRHPRMMTSAERILAAVAREGFPLPAALLTMVTTWLDR